MSQNTLKGVFNHQLPLYNCTGMQSIQPSPSTGNYGPGVVKVTMVYNSKSRLIPTFNSITILEKACPNLVRKIEQESGLCGDALAEQVKEVFRDIVCSQCLTGQEQPRECFYADLGWREQQGLLPKSLSTASRFSLVHMLPPPQMVTIFPVSPTVRGNG